MFLVFLAKQINFIILLKKTTERKTQVKTTPSRDVDKHTIEKYFTKKTATKKDMKIEDNREIEDNPRNISDIKKPASLSTRGQKNGDQNCTTDVKNVKLTFDVVCTDKHLKKKSVSDRITRFQDMVDRNAVCVTGSGRCATHNQKLVRQVVTRKQSCVDKCGGVGWRLCDFTVIVCPTRLSSAPDGAGGDNNTGVSQLRRGKTTNQKEEFTGSNEENQSTAGPVEKRNKTE